ncbi:VOC family protein [Ferruginibacter lapsinanis]|uniref:VOC family protein n=1 Tax=Ferruginibacter lapsinanis TaxID=563172 RepID=UPI001E2AF836|nr:VOC family protein [Ferruginibacter lapsinanis]UEG49671.1 VOC family protein [Ferruginibacter lapsinanis]
MTTSIAPYLTFNGNCRAAMKFYQQCLGGELSLQTIGKSPMADKLPREMKNSILHAVLSKGAISIMASDMVADKGLIKGNTVSLLLHCNSEKEIRSLYEKLSKGGEKTHPPETSFWGALFGDLTDKYGVQWLLHYPLKK